MMRWAILMSGIIELLGGTLIYLYPQLIFQSDKLYLSGLYGIAAMTIGAINLLVFKFYQQSPNLSRSIVITMMGFHGIVSIYISKVSMDFMPLKSQASATHLLLFVIILMCYLKDKKASLNS